MQFLPPKSWSPKLLPQAALRPPQGQERLARGGGTPTGSVRLAVDPAGISGLALIIDGQPATLPSNGLVDLPLTMGQDHRLELTATDADGKPVSWSQVVRVTLVDDAQAIDAQLA